MNFLVRLADGLFGSRLPAVFEERLHRKAFVSVLAAADLPTTPDTELPTFRAIAGYVA